MRYKYSHTFTLRLDSMVLRGDATIKTAKLVYIIASKTTRIGFRFVKSCLD